LALLASAGCIGSSPRLVAVDLAMRSSHRGQAAASVRSPDPRYDIYAGDMHCHVQPPDHPDEARRTLAQTTELAKEEGLDFVVLTPHVPARFFADADARTWVAESQRALRAEIARQGPDAPVYIPGFEYTDPAFGHAGFGFADLDEVLADVPLEVARDHPERFVERFVAHGGVLVVNHPLVTPLRSWVPLARADLSWRPWTQSGPFPAEILAIDRLADGYEAYNLAATYLRDRFLLGDTDRSLRATLARMDREIASSQRRMAPVGGSDSHGHHLRAVMYVLAEGPDAKSVRDAVRAGRVCVREPAGCTFEARGAAEWVVSGGALEGVDVVQARASGDSVTIVLDGAAVARPSAGETVRVPVARGRCSVVRAEVDLGFSGPIYVNCGLKG
jgi:hypothetical protein